MKKKPKKKRLLHAESIPLIDLSGTSRNRSVNEENASDRRRVLPDAFGKPTDKCMKCRIEAAGVVPVETLVEVPPQ